jgi:hypothetical protein
VGRTRHRVFKGISQVGHGTSSGYKPTNNNLSGSLLLAENPPGASADNNASINTDGPVFGSDLEPLAADVDDTAPRVSAYRYVNIKHHPTSTKNLSALTVS